MKHFLALTFFTTALWADESPKPFNTQKITTPFLSPPRR